MKKPTFNKEINPEALNNVNFFDGPIPGQSLTDSPEQPYRWERPPEFTKADEAMMYFADKLLQPETYTEMMKLLSRGQTVDTLAQMILYASFTEGKINPDLMMLCYEPLLFLIMAMAERVDVEYELDDDETELDDLDEDQVKDVNSAMQGLGSAYKTSKQGNELKGMQNVASKLKPEIKEELEEVKTEEIKSLLGRD
jgi:hypothetical protein